MDAIKMCAESVAECDGYGNNCLDVVCRASFAKGFLSQCEGYGDVVALLDAILEPFKRESEINV